MSDDRVIEHPGAYADAALYDLSYSWLDLDLDFYLRTAKAANGPVLEVACGTGRVLLPTLAAGVDIDGFDREPAMIAALERKAAARGLRARVSVADMREFTMPRHYALVTIPFRSFLHLFSTEDQIRTLRAIREHLEPGGSLVFNVFYPSPAIIAKKENRRLLEREFAHPESGRTVAFWDTTTYDRPAQRLSVEREVITQGAPGEPDETRRYSFSLRWAYRFEIELLLEAAGFARWSVSGGYDGRPLVNQTDEMVWTAWSKVT